MDKILDDQVEPGILDKIDFGGLLTLIGTYLLADRTRLWIQKRKGTKEIERMSIDNSAEIISLWKDLSEQYKLDAEKRQKEIESLKEEIRRLNDKMDEMTTCIHNLEKENMRLRSETR